MNDIIIKHATQRDAALIADISRETFYNAFAKDNSKENIDKFMNEVFTHERLMAELTLEDNIFLLAYINDEVMGYVRMRDKAIPEVELNTNNVIEIARIYTVTDKTSKGVGSALMKECLQVAKQNHRNYIWLGVWEKNNNAIRFYERWGFKKFGSHEFILGNDIQTDWLMMRELC